VSLFKLNEHIKTVDYMVILLHYNKTPYSVVDGELCNSGDRNLVLNLGNGCVIVALHGRITGPSNMTFNIVGSRVLQPCFFTNFCQIG
jgi:hypothetical protein